MNAHLNLLQNRHEGTIEVCAGAVKVCADLLALTLNNPELLSACISFTRFIGFYSSVSSSIHMLSDNQYFSHS